MKFIVSSTTLEKHLALLSGVVPSNPQLPILENFLFEIKGGKLIVTAADMSITMTTQLEIETTDEGSLAVPARQLLDTLKSLPEQPLSITIDAENYSLEITSYNGHYKLAGEGAEDFPRRPEPDGDVKVKMSSEVLSEAIANTLFAVSNDELRPSMTGMYSKLDANGITFVATDGNRLVKYFRSDVSSEEASSLIIPKKALSLLKVSLPTDNTDILAQFSGRQAFFTYNNTELSCRLIDENFPDYENAIPTDNPNILEIGRNDLMSTLKRLSIYANKTTNQIRLKLSGSQLQVFAEDLDFSNEANETLTCSYEGEEMEIGFNVKFLIEMLSNLSSKEINFAFSTPSRAGVIKPAEKADEEEILMLIMPVMLSSYA